MGWRIKMFSARTMTAGFSHLEEQVSRCWKEDEKATVPLSEETQPHTQNVWGWPPKKLGW